MTLAHLQTLRALQRAQTVRRGLLLLVRVNRLVLRVARETLLHPRECLFVHNVLPGLLTLPRVSLLAQAVTQVFSLARLAYLHVPGALSALLPPALGSQHVTSVLGATLLHHPALRRARFATPGKSLLQVAHHFVPHVHQEQLLRPPGSQRAASAHPERSLLLRD